VVDIYIGIGSNINPKKHISQALDLLKSLYPSITVSRTFESESVGFKGDNFLNLVAKFNLNEPQESSNDQSLEQLNVIIKQLKEIENQLGRDRLSKKFSARNIDIDILLFGELKINNPIVLPREEILENAYVLWPLSELSPELKALNSRKSYAEYWQQYDKSKQKLHPI